MLEFMCKDCGTTFPRYNTLSTICGRCALNRYSKPRQRIRRKGKRTIEYEAWRRDVAVPYLDKTYGRKCSVLGCPETEYLDVQHKQKRGSHPELKMELSNVEYLCRPHHIEAT